VSSPKSMLQKQLDQQKFLHGIKYVQQISGGIKKLTSNELAYLNHLITNHTTEDTWRMDPAEIEIPTGAKFQVNIISNPLARAREIIGDAFQKAGNGQVIEAAADMYSKLVMDHLFKDANRRTAVLATIWLLNSHGIDIDPIKLHEIPLGDLRAQGSMDELNKKIRNLAGK
jgi:hypothetical protein